MLYMQNSLEEVEKTALLLLGETTIYNPQGNGLEQSKELWETELYSNLGLAAEKQYLFTKEFVELTGQIVGHTFVNVLSKVIGTDD